MSGSTIKQLAVEAARALRRGDHAAAITALRELLQHDPARPDDWYNLAWSLRQTGAAEEALRAYDQALHHGASGAAEIHLNRAVILSEQLQRFDDAEAELRRALALEPGHAAVRLNLGNLYEECGRRDDAIRCYRDLLTVHEAPASLAVEALARLLHLDPPTTSDAESRFVDVERAARAPGVESAARANAWLAIARAADRLGLYARAMAAMHQGNSLIRQTAPPYDRARQEALTDALIEAFPGPYPAPADAPASAGPVFICGMFRSGSTLIERILGSHPEIVAGGELDLLPRIVMGRLRPFPAAARGLTSASAQELAALYRTELHQRLPQAVRRRWATDKRPDNFLFLGLVPLLFPEARIVHTARDPLDTVLSIYMQHLDPRVAPYANALSDIAHHFIQYRRLMHHWERVMPDRIFTCRYDSLVRDPETSLRPLLKFLDLDWAPACLDFNRNSAVVRTASYWQVRRPLYREASGRWRNYADALEEPRLILARAGVLNQDSPAAADQPRIHRH